jgi:O-antigen/teichoic acid export membrane protein
MANLSPDLHNLTAGRRLAWNTVWNLVGEGAPLLVAVVAIPQLLQQLGTARFGVLTLGWMVVGYFTLFDLGMGRALTNLVAQSLGDDGRDSLPPLIWTANILMLAFGIVGGAILAAASPWLIYSAMKIPPALQHETLQAFFLLSMAVPAVVSTTAFRGVLEAYQKFGAANAIRIPMGVFSFAAPLLVLPFSHSIAAVVAVLVVGRYLALIAHIVVCASLIPVMRSRVEWKRAAVGPLLTFGGWMTVSNVIAPVMVSMDRFFVGALVSLPAVAFYATPYEVVIKLLLIPAALAGVFFPAFSTTLVSDPLRARTLYGASIWKLTLVMAPLTLAVMVLAKPGLRIWLGPVFATNSALVLQILAVGVFFSSVAHLPFALIQGAGRPDWTGKLHLVELPIYLAMFWVLTTHFGIVGTAAAWTLRASGDVVALMIMGRRLLAGRAQAKASSAVAELRSGLAQGR